MLSLSDRRPLEAATSALSSDNATLTSTKSRSTHRHLILNVPRAGHRQLDRLDPKNANSHHAVIMPFSKLADIDLLLIIDCLHLEQQLQLCSVSRRFNRIANMSVSRNARLVLLIGHSDQVQRFLDQRDFIKPPADHCTLATSRLTTAKQRLLMTKLPFLKTLEICLVDIPSEQIRKVVQLLRYWGPRLETLKLWYSFTTNVYNEIASGVDNLALFEPINTSMAALKNLTLYTTSYILRGHEAFPIWSTSLESLTLLNEGEPEEVVYQVLQYAKSNANLKSITLGSGVGDWDHLKRVVNIPGMNISRRTVVPSCSTNNNAVKVMSSVENAPTTVQGSRSQPMPQLRRSARLRALI